MSDERRASDADRNRAVEYLNEGLASGRLTLSEHAERLSAVYNSKTLGEIDRLTSDLPSTTSTSPTYPRTAGVFSKVIRAGQWTVGRKTEARALFGVVLLNLGNAELAEREMTLDASAFCGKMVITIPANARVVDEGTALFSKRRMSSAGGGDRGGPIIHITGRSILSKVTIVRAGENPYLPSR